MAVLATICCRFGSWGLFKKLNFCSDFEHKVWSNFLSWSSDKIWSWSLTSFFCWCFVEVMLNPFWILVNYLKLGFVKILKLNFYGEADVWLRFWNWCLVEILMMKFDQDLFLNMWYDLKQVTLVSWTQTSNPVSKQSGIIWHTNWKCWQTGHGNFVMGICYCIQNKDCF